MVKSLAQKSVLGMLLIGLSGAIKAQASSTLSSQFNGGPSVTVTYTDSGGNIQTEGSAAGGFTVTPTSPGGPAFQAFCVSLDVQVGYGPDTIQANVVQPLSSVDDTFFIHSNYSDVGNRLAYILTHDMGDADHDSAAALAVWYTIDKNFSYTGGTAAVNALYSSFISFAGYDPTTAYGGSTAKLFVIDPQGSYQNLIGLTEQSFVPEPAGVVSAVVGLAGVGLIGLRRRKTVA